jgi:hypothetical protein
MHGIPQELNAGLGHNHNLTQNNRNSTVGEVLQPLRVCSKRDSVIASSYECEPGYSVCGCKNADRPGNNATKEEVASFRMSEAGCLRLTSGYIGNASCGESLPGYGFVGFSNMGVSGLTTFTLMSSSNFANLLRYVGDSNDTVTAWLYIVSLVLVSRFILVGIPIAIVSNRYSTLCVCVCARERESARQERESEREREREREIPP